MIIVHFQTGRAFILARVQWPETDSDYRRAREGITLYLFITPINLAGHH